MNKKLKSKLLDIKLDKEKYRELFILREEEEERYRRTIEEENKINGE